MNLFSCRKRNIEIWKLKYGNLKKNRLTIFLILIRPRASVGHSAPLQKCLKLHDTREGSQKIYLFNSPARTTARKRERKRDVSINNSDNPIKLQESR